MSDIRKYAVEQTATVHLRDANDDFMFDDAGEPMQVILYGPASKQYESAQAKNQNRLIEMMRSKGRVNQSAEDKRKENIQLLLECTHSFVNIDYDGKQGDALYKTVYSDPELGFIPEQLGKFIADWSNFTKAPSNG